MRFVRDKVPKAEFTRAIFLPRTFRRRLFTLDDRLQLLLINLLRRIVARSRRVEVGLGRAFTGLLVDVLL